jgi:hypothetical protein
MAAIYIMATVINGPLDAVWCQGVMAGYPCRRSVAKRTAEEHSGEAHEGKELNSIFTVARMGKLL